MFGAAIYREVILDFWFGGSKTRLPSPDGGRQTKSCSDKKTYLAKVVRSGHITTEKWSQFFWFWGSKTRLGKANTKLLWSKNLFSVSWSERPYYYRRVISDFWFGGSKLASLALRAVQRCRRLASAPGAARLVFWTLPVNMLEICTTFVCVVDEISMRFAWFIINVSEIELRFAWD